MSNSSVVLKLYIPVKKQLYTAKFVNRPNAVSSLAYAYYLLMMILSSLFYLFHFSFSLRDHHRKLFISLFLFNSLSLSPFDSLMSSGSSFESYLMLLTFIFIKINGLYYLFLIDVTYAMVYLINNRI